MKFSNLVALLAADLESNGDTDDVMIGVSVPLPDGKRYRLDAVIAEPGDLTVLRDSNVANGMTVIAADYQGNFELPV